MTTYSMTKGQARKFLLRYQGLDEKGPFIGESGVQAYVRRVGCIQYDPLDVVGRNADLVLQARIPGYHREMLDKLLYADRLLIDGWDKMASIYLTEDWPRFHRLRKLRGEEIEQLLQRRSSSGALEILDEIMTAFQEKGPMLSTQLKMGEADVGNWGHRNLSGAAMDYLFNVGKIGISGKRGTQRIYDRIGNLLPESHLNAEEPFPDERSYVKWYTERRVGSIGLLWSRSGGGWLGHHLSNKSLRLSVLDELAEEGRLKTVSIEGITEPFYLRAKDVPLLEAVSAEADASSGTSGKKPVVRVLAPLDNLIWDRDMTERIFGLQYSWEVYLPVEKRKYGYYVLPVLYGDRFVARFEPEPQRGADPIRIRNWWWEKDFVADRQVKADIKAGLGTFAGYLGTRYDGRGLKW